MTPVKNQLAVVGSLIALLMATPSGAAGKGNKDKGNEESETSQETPPAEMPQMGTQCDEGRRGALKLAEGSYSGHFGSGGKVIMMVRKHESNECDSFLAAIIKPIRKKNSLVRIYTVTPMGSNKYGMIPWTSFTDGSIDVHGDAPSLIMSIESVRRSTGLPRLSITKAVAPAPEVTEENQETPAEEQVVTGVDSEVIDAIRFKGYRSNYKWIDVRSGSYRLKGRVKEALTLSPLDEEDESSANFMAGKRAMLNGLYQVIYKDEGIYQIDGLTPEGNAMRLNESASHFGIFVQRSAGSKPFFGVVEALSNSNVNWFKRKRK